MRWIVAALALSLMATSADARSRTRITVTKQQYDLSLPQNPYLFERALGAITCVFVAWGVPPELPPGHPRLGKCPHRNAYTYVRPT